MINNRAYLTRAEQILMDILSIQTCQPEGNEEALVEYLMGLFPPPALCEKIVHCKNRASLIVRVPGRDPEGALAFVGHVDTVAYGKLDSWNTDPSKPTVHDGRIYGRGASDMKGGVAAMTAAALYFLEQGIVPAHDLYFCYTADEESQGMGAAALAAHGFFRHVDRVIIAEPTKGRISVGEKGALWLRATAEGVQTHGSRPELGINAVEMLIEFAEAVKGSLDTETNHPLFGHTTAAVTNFHGGIMTNVIPSEATLELDIRLIPGQSNEAVLARARQIGEALCQKHTPLTISLEVLNDRPAVEVPQDAKLVRDVQAAARQLGLDSTVRGTIFYTDASQIVPPYGMEFLILGPGDDGLAHQSNEYIEISSLHEIIDLYLLYLACEM